MKLKLPSQTIETSTPFVTEEFDIGDKAIIMDILRGKMYSNPIHTVAQEIMSNARDAHREVGKADVPIVVTVPSIVDPSFKIRDFGPGITPDRMANVFIKYGNSTKRDNDVETGGFGLGAKSPFSYTDMFTIVSITPDEEFFGEGMVGLVRREYIAYIDESRIGCMSLVKEEQAKEPQGTTIIVSAKDGDHSAFEASVKSIARYWKVKPQVEPYGATFNWNAPEVQYEGGEDGKVRWQVTKESQPPVVTVDRIPYSLDKFALFGMNDRYGSPEGHDNAWKVLDAGFICHLEVSEVIVTANREKIEWNDELRALVIEILKNCVTIVEAAAAKDIQDAENIMVAIKAYKAMRNKFPISHIKWHGIDLFDFQHRDPNMKDYADIYRYVPDPDITGRVKRKRKLKRDWHNDHSKIPVSPKILIVEDDCGLNNPSTPRIATCLEMADDTGDYLYEEIFVVKFRQEAIKGKDGSLEMVSREKAANRDLNWEAFKTVKLSTVPKRKPNKTKRSKDGIPSSISPIKALSNHVGEGRRWEPVDDTEQTLDKGIGIYLVMSHNSVEFKGNKQDADRLRQLQMTVGGDSPIYSVLKRYVPKLGPDWMTVEDHILAEIDELQKSVVHHKYEGFLSQDLMDRAHRVLKGHLTELVDDSPMRLYIEHSMKIKSTLDQTRRLRKLADLMGVRSKITTDSKTTKLMANEAKKCYPLAFELQAHYYSGNISAALRNDLIMYVNEKDAEAVRATWAIVPVPSPTTTPSTN